MTEIIRVLVADDHQIFRDGLASHIDALPDMTCIGTAANGIEAVSTAQDLVPNVILMDLDMPELDGIGAMRQVRAANPDIGLIVLTMHEDDENIFKALRAGARSYLLKGGRADEVALAVRTVAAGGVMFGPAVWTRVHEFLTASKPLPFPDLTSREAAVLDLLVDGLSTAQIARRMFLNDHTVRNYISSIAHKLEVKGRPALVLRAKASGFGDGSSSDR